MKEYTVKYGQNIYDVALVLHGSIEGIFDILVNNNLSINDTLLPGTVIKYDEDFVINSQIKKWLEDNNTNVANMDRGIDGSVLYGKDLRIIVDQLGASSVIDVKLVSGSMYIDWGDGSEIDIVSNTEQNIFDHPYNDDGRHEIRIFGDFVLDDLDFSEIGGIYYALTACPVRGTFTESTNRTDLMTLFS